MNENIIKILKIASKLDGEGFKDQASNLDKCAENLNLIKQAQYDGVQGYWVRNSRCWQNCYRQKRSSNPDKPIQEVWSDCHNEFVGSLYGNRDSDWGKYADSELGNLKTASKDQSKIIDSQFDQIVNDLISGGDTVEGAVGGAIMRQCSSYTDLMSEISRTILKVASDIKEHNMSDAISLVDVGDSLTKEAQGFFRKLLDTLKGGVSYGKDAISDSRVRGTLERLSDRSVWHLQKFYDSMKDFNETIQETLNIARSATSSGSTRLRNAGEETIQLLDGVAINYDIRPVLERIRSLPWSKWTIPEENVDLTGDSSEISGSGESSTDSKNTSDSSVLPGEEGTDLSPGENNSPVASSGSPNEFISDNMDVAKNVANKIINDMNQSEQGREQIQKLISGLGIRLSNFYIEPFNLKKESQFRDQSEMLEKERDMDVLRAKREAISARPEKEEKMKIDMMTGLAKRNQYRFLTELMEIMGKGQFVSFLNNIISTGRSRGPGGRFRKKIKGTFEDMGGSLDL